MLGNLRCHMNNSKFGPWIFGCGWHPPFSTLRHSNNIITNSALSGTSIDEDLLTLNIFFPMCTTQSTCDFSYCWTVKVQHESETHNGLVAQWLELLVQFQVVWGSIPCEVILLFGYMSWHTDLTVSMLSTLL